MAAHLLGQLEITDPEAFKAYQRDVPAVIAQFGGRYLARGGATEVLEGGGSALRTVLLEFPDMAALRGFYASPAYQPLLALRMRSARSEVMIFEGVVPQV